MVRLGDLGQHEVNANAQTRFGATVTSNCTVALVVPRTRQAALRPALTSFVDSHSPQMRARSYVLPD
ncbi:hypothetical protein NU195Hw_g5273t1 [Hortaea werneckii]